MCGIAGLRLLGAGAGAASRDEVARMVAAIPHRGPDGDGIEILGPNGLGHRRLSIIDPVGGAQPMSDRDGRYWITYNGEIYNFEPLREELESAGRRFRTRSDTEVIIEGFAHWGEGLFARLAGMFTFALLDRETGRLYLARDRLGIKPLYYAERDDALVFASEVKALFAGGRVSPGVNPDVIDFYLTLGYVPGQASMFEGVRKLPPGSFMRVDGRQIDVRRYWRLEDAQALDIGYDEARRQFRELFARTIERHLISDVPLGAFLSGGVDSSAVVAFVRRELGRPMSTFTIGYPDAPEASEIGHARRVADVLETDHHEFELSQEGFFGSVEKLIEHAEEPVVDSAAVALLNLAQQTRPHVTVVLSGEGADEAFAGYDLYGYNLKINRLSWLAGRGHGAAIERLAAPVVRTEKLRKYAFWLSSALEDRYRTISCDVSPGIAAAMRGSRAGGGVDDYFADLFSRVADRDPLARMQYVDMHSWLVDDLLLKADKMTMAASLELRVPFLDHEVVEFGFGLDASIKRRDGVGKALLKDVVSDYVPRDIIYRPKQGFPVPLAKWLREDLGAEVAHILTGDRFLDRGLVEPDYVRRAIDRHRSGAEDLSRRLYSLLILEMWHRRYVDAVAAEPEPLVASVA